MFFRTHQKKFFSSIAIDSSTQYLADGILSGDRRLLAKGITLVESRLPEHYKQSEQLLAYLQKKSDNSSTFRLSISGSPGVGKSTFIESLGLHLVKQKSLKVAILAVDPSSVRTGGSIMGDKTRMNELSRCDNAYIRPSSSRGTLGGVTRNTGQAIRICEAAGYDVILIETVGVGQSETAVDNLVDMFSLLIAPSAGDELQGIKRGIMELSDLIIINKADGELKEAAMRTKAEYSSAINLLRPKSQYWKPKIQVCSALKEYNIPDVWTTVETYRTKMMECGEFSRRRKEQLEWQLWNVLEDQLIERLKRNLAVQESLPRILHEVRNDELVPAMAADKLLQTFYSSMSTDS